MTARRCALCPVALLDPEETHCEQCAPFALDPWYRAPSPSSDEAVLRPPVERDLR